MAYTKQTWETGDTVTADKLNHMEDGIEAGGSSKFEVSLGGGYMSATVSQIQAAYNAGRRFGSCIA